MPEATIDQRVTDAAATTVAEVQEKFSEDWLRDQLPGVFDDGVKEEATAEVAETVEETTDAPVEDTEETTEVTEEAPAETVAETPVAEAPKTTATATDKKPVEEAPVETQRDIRAERRKAAAELTDLRKQLAEVEEADLIDHGELIRKVQDKTAELQLLQEEALTEVDREKAQEAYWDDFEARNPTVNVEKAQAAWDEALTKAGARYGENGNRAVINAYATALFDARVEAMKGSKPASPKPAATAAKPAPKPVVTHGGGRVTPQGATPARPISKPQTSAERIKSGEFRDFMEEIEAV